MKKLYILLTLVTTLSFPLFCAAKEKTQDNGIHNRLGLQGWYSNAGLTYGRDFLSYWNTGGAISLETDLGHYVAFVNTIGIPYMHGHTPTSLFFHGDPHANYLGLYYTLGLRVFLGTPYLFFGFDAGVGVGMPSQLGFSSLKKAFLMLPFSAGLGVNVPLTRSTYLQLMMNVDFLEESPLLDFRVGLQFSL